MQIAVTFLDDQGKHHDEVPINDVARHDFVGYRSIRSIPAHKGQRHLPGFYWFSSIDRLVPYESRLEMFTLMTFDFEGDVIDVLAQPLLFCFVQEETYRHIPDFLMWRECGGVTLVDVKPGEQVGKDRNRRAFESTEIACQHLGWAFDVRTEPDEIFLANLKWLAGYRRRPPRFKVEAARILEICAEQATSIGDLLARSNLPILTRPVVFHLLWKRVLKTDMSTLLNEQSLIYLSASKVKA